MKERGIFRYFSFLFPSETIRKEHLSKHDVKNVRAACVIKNCSICFVLSVLLLAINLFILISNSISYGISQIELFGITSFITKITTSIACLISVILGVISLTNRQKDKKVLFARISLDLFCLALLSEILMFVYADAESGYLSATPSISASVILLIFLLIINPTYFLDTLILDLLTSVGLIALVICCYFLFDIQAVYYYIAYAAIFPVISYILRSTSFYAEVQQYVQELKNEFLYNTALYDELTHCKNRFALKEHLTNNIKRWTKDNTTLLLIMFDIDEFKQYNDQFSHQAGDYCLLSIANQIRKTFPNPSLNFYRYGGEEFLIFFEMENLDRAPFLMEKIRCSVSELKIEAPKGAPNKYVTISAGATLAVVDEKFSFEDTIALADKYLYQAKSSGKNICVLDGTPIK